MKSGWCAVVAVIFGLAPGLAADDKFVEPDEAARRVASGEAVLVDVREPEEWKSGVVAGATLLPLSDLRNDGKNWQAFLAENRDKELILYCRSGNRSGQAAAILDKKGFQTANAGGFKHWKSAGQRVVKPE